MADDPRQQYSLVVWKDSWKHYKTIGPFASYEVVKRWLNDHPPKDPTAQLIMISPITPSSKVADLF